MASSLDRNQQCQVQSLPQKFNNFVNQLGGNDPKQIVQNLLKSGKMSQQQFNQLSNMAKQIEPMLFMNKR